MTTDGEGRELARLRSKVAELERELTTGDAAVRSIAENSPDNIMLLDREGRIQYINWTVPDLTVDQVIGTPVSEFVPEEFRPTIKRCLARVLETKQPDRYETAYISEDGAISNWESRVGAVVRDGEVVGFATVSSNITERRQAAADRDRFFNLSVDMLCVQSMDGYFVRINPAFENALGYTEEELLSRPFVELIHPADAERTREALRELQMGKNLLDFENRYRRKDGRYRWFSWRASVDPARKIVYAVARDVTDKRTLETQLRRSQKMDAIGQLAGGVAHDFNNLVLAIQANVEFAAREEDRGQRNQFLSEVKRASQRAADLTRQLLTFSRRQVLRPVALDMNTVTKDLMKMLRRLIPESITLEFRPREDLLSVFADPGQIEQVIVNLCVNARDAITETGAITLETANQNIESGDQDAQPWARPGPYVRLRVKDTGGGMSAEVRERLFEPFFSTKEPGKGTGLGLSTVYGIVQQHKGFIQVQSEPGQGAEFDVYLPVSGQEAESEVGSARVATGGGNETILLAEDEEIVREVVHRTLVAAGYRVLSAKDGAEALDLFKANREDIDLALLDVIMPHLSGPQVLREIRATSPDLRVLFTSGYSDASTFRDVNVHSVAVIQKPYDPETLLHAIRSALDGDSAS